MRPVAREGHYGQPVTVDHCTACRLLWFDFMETVAISRQGLLILFRLIREAEDAADRPLGTRLLCPRCDIPLVRTHDLTRHGRTIHHRCPQNHGHAVTHAQFLAEKGLLRPLTQADLTLPANRLLAVACVNCGAPLHAIEDCHCPYCHSPVVVLDVRKALEALEVHDQNRRARADAQDAGIERLIAALHRLTG